MSAEDYPQFDDVRLERGFDYGSRGGYRWQTQVIRVSGGYTDRNQDWSQFKGQWETGERAIGQQDMDYITRFFNSRRGALRRFRYKNWQDFAAADELFHIGDGSTRIIQLTKTYADAGDSHTQDIQLPIASTFAMTRQLPPAAAAAYNGYTLDPIGGTVTLTPDTAYVDLDDLTADSAADSFTSPSIDTSNFAVGQIILVSGFADAAGNGQFKIATIADANTITVTLPGGGAANLPDETPVAASLEDEPNIEGALYRWSGEFDLPAAFAQDEFNARFDAYRSAPQEAIFNLASLVVEVDRLRKMGA